MNIDSFIVFGYLIGLLLIGIYYGRNIKDIKDFALGGKNFTTPVLAATIIATYASSSGFYVNITKSYEDGLYKLLSTSSGQIISLLITGFFIVPKMKKFADKLTIAEILGSCFGTRIRVISSIPIFIVSSGFIALQIKVLSSILEYLTDIHPHLCVILTALILTIYSAIGGIRAVTFTDFIQFITFAIVLPIIFYIVFDTIDPVNNLESSKKLFDHLFVYDEKKFYYYFFLFLYFCIPSMNPPLVQRLLMAKNTNQMRNSIFIAVFFLSIFMIITNFMGDLLFVSNSELEQSKILPYLFDNFTSKGIKGLLISAIIAMAMSTADSDLNAGSVCFAHDFCRPLGLFSKFNEVFLSRVYSLLSGLLAIILAFNFSDILCLITFVYSFYAPVITVPSLFALFGYKISEKAILSGILSGIITSLAWPYIMKSANFIFYIDSFLPAILVNFITAIAINKINFNK